MLLSRGIDQRVTVALAYVQVLASNRSILLQPSQSLQHVYHLKIYEFHLKVLSIVDFDRR